MSRFTFTIFLLLATLLFLGPGCREFAGYGAAPDLGNPDQQGDGSEEDADLSKPESCGVWNPQGPCPVPRQLALGATFSCLLAEQDGEGAVYCWGDNTGRVVGKALVPEAKDALSPVRVHGVAVKISDDASKDRVLASGGGHACAVDSDGEVLCWGYNGDGQAAPSSPGGLLPAQRVNLGDSGKALEVDTGHDHSCARTEEGKIYCWGDNTYGQLGQNGGPGPALLNLPEAAKALSCGSHHCCALTGKNSVYCWGDNRALQLGQKLGNDIKAPLLVPFTDGLKPPSVEDVACGGDNCCIVANDHQDLICWGDNTIEQLLVATNDQPTLPTKVPHQLEDIAAVTVGRAHLCARQADGQSRCWGFNRFGQTSAAPSGRVAPRRLGRTYQHLGAGYLHSCGISNGEVYCWGRNRAGQLGSGRASRRATPVSVQLPAQATIRALASGAYHSCAADNDGHTYCWGYNAYRQAGSADVTVLQTPTRHGKLLQSKTLAMGAFHSCALDESDVLRCWGAAWEGQLGQSITEPISADPLTIGLGPTYTGAAKLSASGHDHGCAVDGDGAVWCWGSNEYGQIASPATETNHLPQKIDTLGVNNRAIIAHLYSSCAVTKDETLRCWGASGNGQIGTTTTLDGFSIPEGYENKKVRDVALGSDHGCAILDSGEVECWGRDQVGRIGVEPGTPHGEVVKVSKLTNIDKIAAGLNFTCAIDSAKKLWCWGANTSHQLGTDAVRWSHEPLLALPDAKVEDIAPGWEHVCALLEGGTVRCWGDALLGQLGHSAATSQYGPLRILP